MQRRWSFLLVLCGLLVLGCPGDPGATNNNQNLNDNDNGNSNGNDNVVCGNGQVETGEECDDGEDNSDSLADACRSDCRLPYCADGVQDTGEACDDANVADNDGCISSCDGTDTCCVMNVCGDGHVNETEDASGDPAEACDDGNTADGDDCRGDCRQDHTLCGNGSDDPGEECDAGVLNSDTVPDACRTDCRLPWCGDGVKDLSESCDGSDVGISTCATIGQGFDSGAVSCQAGCTFDASDCGTCGDGIINGAEVCDGSLLDGETCASLGFTFGSLTCGSCSFDTAACVGFTVQTLTSGVNVHLNDVGANNTSWWIGGDNNTLLTSSDGQTWSSVSRAFDVVLGVWADNDSLFFVGRNGYSLERDAALSWNDISPNGVGEVLHAVAGQPGTRPWAVGNAGRIIRHLNNNFWTPGFGIGGPTTNLYDVWVSSSGDFFAVGADGTIVNNVGGWSYITVGTEHFRSVWGRSTADLYVVGTGGVVRHNTGSGWAIETAPAGTPTLRAVWGDSAMGGVVYAVGGGGWLMVSDGSAWYALTSGTPETLSGIFGLPATNTVIAVGENGTILKIETF